MKYQGSNQKDILLTAVKTMDRKENDWWEQVETEAKVSINKGIRQAKEGKTTPHAEVMKKYDKWFNKN